MRITKTSRLCCAVLIAALLIAALPLVATSQETAPSSSLLVKLVAGLTAEQQAAVIARNGGVETSSIPALSLHVVSVGAADLATILVRYQADSQVLHVEINKTRQSETIVPSDPLYSTQWALPKIGWNQVFGVIAPVGAAKVALLDTGVDASHPELAGKVLPGISFRDGSDGRTDSSGHGTWLAGIIAANTDTVPVEGIASVAYAGVQIMPVTVLNANGEGQDGDAIAGVIWAADHGADVILMAFSAPEFSQNLQDAIDYAWSKGAVVVAAAGNNALSTPTFPAGDRGVMGVAATDQSDGQAYFSNQGQAVFIAAPGVDIQTLDLNGNYIVISGTSASAAHVAGLAAFMKAVEPSLTNGVIVGRIARNADPAGTTEQTGNGRINMPRALADTSMDPVQPAGADPVGNGGPFVGPYRAGANSSATVSGKITDAANGSGTSATVTCSVTGGGGTCTPVSQTSNSSTGIYSNFSLSWNGNGSQTVTITATKSNYETGPFSSTVNPNDSITNANIVLRRSTTTSVVLQTGANPSTFGQSLTFKATVTSLTSGTPAGTVTFKDGGNTISCTGAGDGTLNGAGQATCSTAALNAGSHSITATYNGNTGFADSTSPTLTQTVNQATTTTTVASDASPSTFNQSVTFTATVTSSSGGAPTGTVTFKDGATTLGTGSLSASSPYQATFTTSTLAVGSHSITAVYGGDTNSTGSTSSALTQTVNEASTTTTVTRTSGANPSTFGQSLTFTATVTGANGGIPTGTVQFKIDGANSGSPVSLSGGSASMTTSTLGAGSHTVAAVYSGSTSFLGSTSADVSQTVNQATTTTTLTSSVNPSVLNQSTTFTATVTGSNGGAPTGTVTFKDGPATLGTGTLSASSPYQATFATSSLSQGSHSITAVYAGDSNSTSSTSATLTQTVNKRGTSTSVTCPSPVVIGQAGSCTVTVTDTSAGTTSTPTGTMTLNASGTAGPSPTSGSCDLAGSGASATCSVGFTGSTAGTISIAATTYAGDTLHAGSTSSSTSITVNKRATSTGVSCDTPAGNGQSSTCTATVTDTSPGIVTTPGGTVSFTVSGATPPSPSCSLAGGGGASVSCSVTLTAGSAGTTASVTGSYGGDTTHATSSGNASIVIKRATTTSVSCTSPVNVGQSSSCTVTVADPGQQGGQNTPTGTVTVTASGASVLPTSVQCTLPNPGNGGSGTCSVSFTGNAGGLISVTAQYAGDSSHAGSSGTTSVTVNNPAPTTGSISPTSKTVGDAGFTLTVNGSNFISSSVVRFNGSDRATTFGSASQLTATILAGDLTTAGTFNITVFNPTPGGGTSNAQTFTVNAAATTTSINAPTITYNANGSVTVSVSSTAGTVTGNVSLSVNGGLAASKALSGGSATFTNADIAALTSPSAGDHSLSATYAAQGNFAASSATGSLHVNQASSTTTVSCPASVTYIGSAQTPCTATVTGVGGLNQSLTVSYTNNTNAGTATASASFAGDTNHTSSNDSKNFTIDKAGSTTSVSCPASVTFNGAAQTPCTASVSGAGGLSQSLTVSYLDNANAGTATASASFAGDANHNSSTDSKTFTIDKAASTTTVSCPASVTFSGSAQTPCSASVTGAGGLSQSLSVSYLNNVNAGTATANASYAGDANHTSSSDSKTFTIDKASSVTTVSCPASMTFNGAAQTPCSASVTGAGGLSQPLSVSYLNNVNAGTATASATFGGDANHTGSIDSKTFTIDKAASTTTVTLEAGPYVYRASAFTATAQVTGVGGLNSPVSVVYSGDCTNVTAANGCTATATFAGDGNHNGSTDSKSITIDKAASTTTVTFEAGPYTYRGSAFTATASVTGVGGLSAPVAVVYSGDCTNVTVANGCTATATYTGDGNHTGSTDSKSITVDKASSTTTLAFEASPYTYRGSAFTATASVSGVGGLSAPVAVVYSGDCTNVTVANGCTATATYTGDGNHNGSTDSKSITITQAGSTTTVTFESGPYVYRSAAFTATAQVIGIGGLNSPVAVVYSGDCTNVSVVNGCTATATYAGDSNHIGSSDSKSITITQASTATSVVAGTTRGAYTAKVSPVAPASSVPTGTVQFSIDGNPIGGPVVLDGSGQATSLVLSTPETAGLHTITAQYSGNVDYIGSSGSLTDTASAVADDAYATLQTSTLVVGAPGVLLNDADADTDSGQILEAFVTQPPAQGALTLNTDGSFSYTPTPGVAGLGSFTFKYSVFDGVLYSPEATVTITVLEGNKSPVAINDAYSMTGASTTVLAASGVLANDQGTTALTAAVVASTQHGDLTLNADGSFTYTPNADFTGVDSFLYHASDGLNTSNLSMVTITVLAAANTDAVNDYYLTSSPVSGDVLSNDNGGPTAAAVVTPPLYGTLTAFPGNGTFTYTPGINFAGVDSFTYRASGGTNSGNLAAVTIRDPDISVNALTVTYGDDATVTVTVTFPGLGSATGSVSLSAVNATVATPSTTALDVNGQAQFTITQPAAASSPHALIATYTNGAYNGSSTGSGSLAVNKATPTINWSNPADITYGTALDGTQLNATATFNGNPVTGTSTYAPPAGTVLNAGQNQNLHVDFAPDDAGNFNANSKDVLINVKKASVTVTANDKTKTYGDANPTFDVSYNGFVNGEGAGVLGGSLTFNFAGKPPTSYGPSTTVPTDAGTYAIRPSGLTGSNYDITFKGGTYAISQAPLTITPDGGKTKLYGQTFTAFTGNVVGLKGADQVTVTYASMGAAAVAVVGGYDITVDTVTFTVGSAANYAVTENTATNGLTVNKAPLTVTANDKSKTYADTDPTFDVSYSGFVNGEGAGVLGGSLTFNFAGKPPTNYGPSTTVPVDAGTYAIRPSGLTSDNYAITFKAGTYTVNKASSTTTVTFESGPYVYRGTAFTATAEVTGAGGLNQPVAVVYSGDCTNVTAANGCTATATFGGDGNHDGSSDSKSITIDKASSTTTLSFEAGPYVYRASAFTATASVTGIGGLNQPVAVVYSGDCTNVTSANGCTATATFGGDGNHNGSSDSKSITIDKAGSTTTLSFEAGPYVYRASAFTATASVTGIGGLNQPVAVAYTGDCTNVTVANGCTATATFAGDGNHDGSSDSKSIAITQAPSAVSVTWNSYTYDGTAHPASGFAYGVTGIGDVLSPAVTFSYAGTGLTSYGPSPTPPSEGGSYEVTATFAGNGNYTGSSNIADITIGKADPTVTANGATCVYAPSTPCPGSGSATGVHGEDLGAVNLAYRIAPGSPLPSAPVNAGTYQVAARFPGNANYKAKQSAPASILINKASATLALSNLIQLYSGSPESVTVTTDPAGLSGVSVTYEGSPTAPTAAGSYAVVATLTNDNYTAPPAGGTLAIVDASAGTDQTVDEGANVTLSGSGYGLTYAWTQVSPASPRISINNPSSLLAGFTAPQLAGGFGSVVFTFQLKVSDGDVSKSSTVNVTVKNVNHAPVASATAPAAVAEGTAGVQLNGSTSYDPDGADPLTYSWVQTSGPMVTLAGANTATAAFTAPLLTGGVSGPVNLTFELTVSDGTLSDKKSVTVAVDQVDHAPTANAGSNQTVNVNTLVTLDGSLSSDPDGDALTYAWTQVAGPTVTLDTTNPAKPKFTAPNIVATTDLKFNLVVSDGVMSSTNTAQVKITVVNENLACEAAAPSTALLWPPDHRMVPISIVGITDPANVPPTITITTVTSDEPTNGLGDGDTAIDAAIQPNGTVLIRAERSGKGDGRVYVISYTASTPLGTGCSGTVKVGVPHDQSKAGSTPINSGQHYNATQ